MSTEIISTVNPIYDITKNILIDNSTESLEFLEFYDVNNNAINNNQTFRIEIKDNENLYLLNKSYLFINFNLIDVDGTGAAFPANSNVSLQNNAVGMFRRWILEFDDIEVETVDDAHICNTVQNLVYYSDQYSSTIAKSQIWYPDTLDSSVQEYVIANGNNLYTQGIDTVNLGHRKRRILLDGSRQFTCKIPLRNVFGLVKAHKGVLKGIKIGLRLERNLDTEVILNGANNFGKVFFNKIQLYCPRVKPNLMIYKDLVDQLSGDRNITIPFIDAQLFRSNLYNDPAGPVNRLFQIKAKRREPIKLFAAFMLQARYNGDRTVVKRIFDNVGLTKIRVVLNGTTQYPEREFTCNFAVAAKDYSNVYNMFLQCGMKDNDVDQSSIVTYDNFETLYPIFCIDMTKHFELHSIPNSALLDVYISATAANFYGYYIIESERKCNLIATDGTLRFLNVQ